MDQRHRAARCEQGHRSAPTGARREKLDALVERGIAPFGYSFDRTHEARDAVALHAEGIHDEGETVRVAGRIVAWRAHGKTTFAHVADDSGRIQLYFKKDQLGDDRYASLDLLDIGLAILPADESRQFDEE